MQNFHTEEKHILSHSLVGAIFRVIEWQKENVCLSDFHIIPECDRPNTSQAELDSPEFPSARDRTESRPSSREEGREASLLVFSSSLLRDQIVYSSSLEPEGRSEGQLTSRGHRTHKSNLK